MVRFAMLISEQVSTEAGKLIDVDWEVPEIDIVSAILSVNTKFMCNVQVVGSRSIEILVRKLSGENAKTKRICLKKSSKIFVLATNMDSNYDAHSSLS